jgi:hypothetical protein
VKVEKAVLLCVGYGRNEMFWNDIENTEILPEAL